MTTADFIFAVLEWFLTGELAALLAISYLYHGKTMCHDDSDVQTSLAFHNVLVVGGRL